MLPGPYPGSTYCTFRAALAFVAGRRARVEAALDAAHDTGIDIGIGIGIGIGEVMRDARR